MQGCSDSGRLKWIPTGKNESFFITPDFFRYYDSFRTSTGSSGNVVSPHEKYKRKIIFWFFRRHYLSLISRFLLLFLFLWFTVGGGFGFVFKRFVSFAEYSSSQNSLSAPVSEKKSLPGTGGDKSVLSSVSKTDSQKIDPVFDPVLFMDDFVVLKNGVKLKKGSIYEGFKIENVDKKSRSYSLSDGRSFSL